MIVRPRKWRFTGKTNGLAVVMHIDNVAHCGTCHNPIFIMSPASPDHYHELICRLCRKFREVEDVTDAA